MGQDDDRSAILRRRRFFVATAMAGLAATQCDKPQVCLNISVVEDSGTSAPTVCLSPLSTPPDAATPITVTPEAGTDSGIEAGTDAGLDAGKRVRPTTTPTRPLVCLSPIRKPSSDG